MTRGNSGKMTRRMMLGTGFAAGTAFLPKVNAFGNSTAEHGRMTGNSILGTEAGVHHVGMFTREWDRSTEFYRKGLGFTVRLLRNWGVGANRRWLFLDSGNGIYIELFEDL